MGRGLSDLQKTILTMAYERRQRGEGSRPADAVHVALGERLGWGRPEDRTVGCDLDTAYLLANHFKWPLKLPWVKLSLSGHQFDVEQIGEKECRSTRAAVSRSFKRLEDRGLAYRVNGAFAKWTGINLTEAGMEVARELSVNEGELIPQH